jgi:hypothetical protein
MKDINLGTLNQSNHQAGINRIRRHPVFLDRLQRA